MVEEMLRQKGRLTSPLLQEQSLQRPAAAAAKVGVSAEAEAEAEAFQVAAGGRITSRRPAALQ